MKELLFWNILGNITDLNRKEMLSLAVANWLEDLVLLLWMTKFQNWDFVEK